MKNFNKIILGILLFTITVFLLGYITRIIYGLKDTNIKENIVLSFKGKEGLFLLNPNTEETRSFSGSYSEIENINMGTYTRIYSSDNKYYFNIFGIYDDKDNLLNSTWLSPKERCKVFWTNDSKYLIRMDGHVVRMFGLFFSTPTIEQVIHIIEPSTKKSKQILLYDEEGKLLEVETIKGYVR